MSDKLQQAHAKLANTQQQLRDATDQLVNSVNQMTDFIHSKVDSYFEEQQKRQQLPWWKKLFI